MTLVDWAQVIGAGATAVTAAVALVAACFAYAATKATRDATRASLLSDILSEYGRGEMHSALAELGLLRDRATRHPQALQTWFSQVEEEGVLGDAARRADEARRMVKLYFLRIAWLATKGYLQDGDCKVIGNLSGLALMYEFIPAMEEKRHGKLSETDAEGIAVLKAKCGVPDQADTYVHNVTRT